MRIFKAWNISIIKVLIKQNKKNCLHDVIHLSLHKLVKTAFLIEGSKSLLWEIAVLKYLKSYFFVQSENLANLQQLYYFSFQYFQTFPVTKILITNYKNSI